MPVYLDTERNFSCEEPNIIENEIEDGFFVGEPMEEESLEPIVLDYKPYPVDHDHPIQVAPSPERLRQPVSPDHTRHEYHLEMTRISPEHSLPPWNYNQGHDYDELESSCGGGTHPLEVPSLHYRPEDPMPQYHQSYHGYGMTLDQSYEEFDDFEVRYHRNLRNLAKSMRRSEATRRQVIQQRQLMPEVYAEFDHEDDLLSGADSGRCFEFKQSRTDLLNFILNELADRTNHETY